jgi:hypothetical protein
MRVPGEHGSDVIVPHLRELGDSIIYTRYNTGGHNIWVNAYQNPMLLPWMFAQKRGQFAASTPGLTIDGSTIEGNTITLWGKTTAAANFTRVGWSVSAIEHSATKADGVADGTTTFVSESSAFDKSFVGQRLGILPKNPDLGISFYEIVAVDSPTSIKLGATLVAGTYSFVTYPLGTMENPFPATGAISPTWRLEKIPLSGNVRQIQVVGEFPSGVANYGGVSTINQMFIVK